MDVFYVHHEIVEYLDLDPVSEALLLMRGDVANHTARNLHELLLHELLSKDVWEAPILLGFRRQNQVHSLQLYCDGAALDVEHGDLDRELLDDTELDIDRQHELVEGIAAKLDICHVQGCLGEAK